MLFRHFIEEEEGEEEEEEEEEEVAIRGDHPLKISENHL